MKRIALIALMLLICAGVEARSIRYFTYSQASRTVAHLDRQAELMIYCGYDYEIETYVLVNEVWMERVNSSYYEIWLYGYDAYTGDEIYMPIDLQCIWLMGQSGRVYNAAQYLRFHASVHQPAFAWYIPPYHPFTRRPHAIGYIRTYHYDVHRYGWMPPHPPAHGWGPHTQPPLPPYYMRTPQQPAPAPTTTWTPGIEHPQISDKPRTSSNTSSIRSNPSEGTTSRNSGTARTGQSSTSRSSSNTSTTRTTATTPTRKNTGTTSTTRTTHSSTSRDDSASGTTRQSSGTTTRQSSGTTTRQSTGNSEPTTSRTGTSSTNTRQSSGTTTNRQSTTTRQSSGTTNRSSASTSKDTKRSADNSRSATTGTTTSRTSARR